MEFKVRFSGRAHNYTEGELLTMLETARQANPLTQGSYLRKFEDKFRNCTGAAHAFAVSNATGALEIIAQLCCFEDGDEIIIPSHTFTSSAYPFVKNHANIVWADIDPDTRVVTAETIADKITNRTRAILVVHLYGYMADMKSIIELAEREGLLVIEDAAQAIGTESEGKQAGTWGDFSAFSFHSHKNISTLGEGGMLVVRNPEHAGLIPMLRHNGHCKFPEQGDDYWIPAMGNVDLPVLNGRNLFPGNYCIGEVECALGIKLLDRINEINSLKQLRAIRFIDALADYKELRFHRVESRRHNYHLLAAEVENNLRNDFIREMAHEKKVQCVVQYYPLNRYPFYSKLGFGNASCPNADKFFDNMVSFPFHHWLSDEDLEYVLESTIEVLDTLRN